MKRKTIQYILPFFIIILYNVACYDSEKIQPQCPNIQTVVFNPCDKELLINGTNLNYGQENYTISIVNTFSQEKKFELISTNLNSEGTSLSVRDNNLSLDSLKGCKVSVGYNRPCGFDLEAQPILVAIYQDGTSVPMNNLFKTYDIDTISDTLFKQPKHMAVEQINRTIYVADETARQVFKIKDDNVVEIIGNGMRGYNNILVGIDNAKFDVPTDVALTENGSRLFIADDDNNLIRRVEGKQVFNFAGIKTNERYDSNFIINPDSCKNQLKDFKSIEVNNKSNVFIASYELGLIYFIEYDFNTNANCQYNFDTVIIQNDKVRIFEIADLLKKEISGLYLDKEKDNLFIALHKEGKILLMKNASNPSREEPIEIFNNKNYNPFDLVVDEDNNLFFVDKENSQLVYFHIETSEQLFFLSKKNLGLTTCLFESNRSINISRPHGISIVEHNNFKDLYITQHAHKHIMKISIK